jgi:hypothetical protein
MNMNISFQLQDIDKIIEHVFTSSSTMMMMFFQYVGLLGDCLTNNKGEEVRNKPYLYKQTLHEPHGMRQRYI